MPKVIIDIEKKKTPITVTIEQKYINQINEFCKKNFTNKSKLVEEMIKSGLNNICGYKNE